MVRPRELAVFSLVGNATAAVHFAVVAACVPLLGLTPLVANVVGFVASFGVAFTGHARWSFPQRKRSSWGALPRFALVSILFFGLNEAAYAGALEWVPLDYRVSLLLIMTALGLAKLVASKFWVFAAD